MSLTLNMVGGGAKAFAFIVCTYPSGSVCTATNGTKTFAAPNTSGFVVFRVPTPVSVPESWTVTITDGNRTVSKSISITSEGQSASVVLTYMYGIKRVYNVSSPDWTREGLAASFTATASVGTTAGSSDYDSVYPWSGITRETLDSGDVMVKIPRFAYRRFRDSDNYEHIQIAESPISDPDGAGYDFVWHPAFLHNNTEQEYIYVGAYETGTGYISKSGLSPITSTTRASARTNSKAKGTGWGLMDLSTWSAIQMLIVTEFAVNDIQTAIGDGYSSASAKINTGSCDSVPNLTGRPAGTSNNVGVIWRGIENPWGNVWQLTDGLNWNNGTYWISNDQSVYADSTSTNYTALNFTGATNWSGAWFKTMGLDNAHSAYQLAETVGGSNNTYYCDGGWSTANGWKVFTTGGGYDNGKICGIFSFSVSDEPSGQNAWVGSRLLYIPQN